MRHGKFTHCRNCTNGREGAKVFRCRSCGHQFCEDCCTGGLLSRHCPKCGHSKSTDFGTGWQGLGFIEPQEIRMTRVPVRG